MEAFWMKPARYNGSNHLEEEMAMKRSLLYDNIYLIRLSNIYLIFFRRDAFLLRLFNQIKIIRLNR